MKQFIKDPLINVCKRCRIPLIDPRRTSRQETALKKCRIPFDDPPLADKTIQYKRISVNKFFRRFAACKNCHSAFRGIAKRAGRHEYATRMEFIQPFAVRWKMCHDFWQRVRRDFVKRNYFHYGNLAPWMNGWTVYKRSR